MSKSFGTLPVVKNISFKSNVNEVLVILGTNGAGKTTTFKSITGDTSPSAGSI